MTIDPEFVKQDAERLQQTYTETISDLDQTWRALYLERNPRKVLRQLSWVHGKASQVIRASGAHRGWAS